MISEVWIIQLSIVDVHSLTIEAEALAPLAYSFTVVCPKESKGR
jgi:hypothetical protein